MDGTAPCRRRITSATIPVHPVWCATPRPAALSPWKYSLNTRLSFQFGSCWNRSTHPKQGRRPSGPTNNGMDPGSTSARTVLGLLRYVDGQLESAQAFVSDGEKIHAIYAVRNPDKLAGIALRAEGG